MGALLALTPGLVVGAPEDEKIAFQSLRIGNAVVQNVRVTEVTPTHVTIFFDGGGSRLKRQDLPPELKALYPYDARAAAEYEKQEAGDRAQRAALEKARQARFNRELTASLQRQRPVVQRRIEQLEKELAQLDREMMPMKAKAKGKPASSPARMELDRARDKRLDLIKRLGEEKKLMDSINKQLARGS